MFASPRPRPVHKSTVLTSRRWRGCHDKISSVGDAPRQFDLCTGGDGGVGSSVITALSLLNERSYLTDCTGGAHSSQAQGWQTRGGGGSEWSGCRVGMGGDGVWAGVGAGVADKTLPSPSRESSLSRTMPSADEAMVEDSRGRLQAYTPAESYAGARAGALWPENEDI